MPSIGYINLGDWNEGSTTKKGFVYNGEGATNNELKITGCKVRFVGIDASDQTGIYARFA